MISQELSPAGASGHARPAAVGLSRLERAALVVGIVEIPLQIDKYFFFREEAAILGAVPGLNVSITTAALIVLYGIWIGDASLRRQRARLRPIVGFPMLLYLAIVLISAVSASLRDLSIFDFAILAQSYLLFFYIANRIQTHKDLLLCVMALAATLLIESLLIFGVAALGLDGQELEVGPLLFKVDEGKRHAGTMYSPVLAGSTLALIWLPVAASLVFTRDKWVWRIALLATMAGLVAILMTQTRGAVLTTAVGILIIGGGLLSRGWLPVWTIPLTLLLGALSVYPLIDLYQKRIQHGDGESADSRRHLSLIALETISERPILGHGAGNCFLAGQRIASKPEYRGEWYYTIHCKYLLVWIETGILGLLAFVTILGTGFCRGIAAWRTRNPALSVLGLALAAALAGHMLHMAVDVFNSRPQVQMLWCVLGLIAAVYKLSHQQAFQRVPALRRRPTSWVPAATQLSGGAV